MRCLVSLCLLAFMSTPAIAEKAIFVKQGKLCGKKLKLKSFKQACSKKKYRGKRVFKCKNKCQKRKGLKCVKRKWEVVDAAVCNSDGKKKGYYLSRCSGTPIKAKSIMDACSKSQAKGKTVVQCKYGTEIKRQACSSAKNNDEKGIKIGVFIEKCGGRLAKKAKKNGKKKAIWYNLKKACKQKAYKGKTLVRCSNKCSKRKGLKCVRWTWKETKRVTCNEAGKATKLVTCNEKEGKQIAQARVNAGKGITTIINGMKAYLKNPKAYYEKNGDPASRTKKLKKRDKDWVAKALKIAKKARTKMKKMPSKYECDGDKDRCDGDARAHTIGWQRNSVKFCNPYLEMTVERKAAVLIHEVSHNCGTDDITYNRKKIKDIKWWNNAETYEWWYEKGRFCIPGYDC